MSRVYKRKGGKLFIPIISTVLLAPCCALAFNTVFYTGPAGIKGATSFLQKNKNKVSILAPQVLDITANGNIKGTVSPFTANFAKTNKMKVMPLAVNSWFHNKAGTHFFLENKYAQQKAINELTAYIKNHQFYGLQIDFENMSHVDRERFTHFYENLATKFHKNHLKISIAVSSLSFSDLKKGVYDIKALGKASDFVSIMTYDLHYSGSAPGPVASTPFDIDNIKLALQYLPANKVSLGIPSYGYHWQTDHRGKYISYRSVQATLREQGIKAKWDPKAQVPYVDYSQSGVSNVIYFENQSSFKDKLMLAKKYKLGGISVWSVNDIDANDGVAL